LSLESTNKAAEAALGQGLASDEELKRSYSQISYASLAGALEDVQCGTSVLAVDPPLSKNRTAPAGSGLRESYTAEALPYTRMEQTRIGKNNNEIILRGIAAAN
jgi:hypothetical protein